MTVLVRMTQTPKEIRTPRSSPSVRVQESIFMVPPSAEVPSLPAIASHFEWTTYGTPSATPPFIRQKVAVSKVYLLKRGRDGGTTRAKIERPGHSGPVHLIA